jgi:hypothetical protein
MRGLREEKPQIRPVRTLERPRDVSPPSRAEAAGVMGNSGNGIPHRDGQVQTRPLLAERPGRQVHHHATERPLRARALDRRSDPIARVLHARAVARSA